MTHSLLYSRGENVEFVSVHGPLISSHGRPGHGGSVKLSLLDRPGCLFKFDDIKRDSVALRSHSLLLHV